MLAGGCCAMRSKHDGALRCPMTPTFFVLEGLVPHWSFNFSLEKVLLNPFRIIRIRIMLDQFLALLLCFWSCRHYLRARLTKVVGWFLRMGGLYGAQSIPVFWIRHRPNLRKEGKEEEEEDWLVFYEAGYEFSKGLKPPTRGRRGRRVR